MTGKQSKNPKDSRNAPGDLIKAKDYFKDKNRLLDPPIYRAAYSDRTAWILSSMSHLAYDRFETGEDARKLLIAKLRGGGFKLVETFNSDKTDTQAILVSGDQYLVLAFRGTEVTKLQDVKMDAKAFKATTIEGRLHSGFKQAYESVAPSIMKSLLSMGDLPVYITGHSLGAALATVATQNLENDPRLMQRIAACYTFGSPRVGNDQYDREFKAPIYRMVNTTDIVTVVPLLLMGYIHIGDVRFLSRQDGELRRGVPIFRRIFFFIAALFRVFGPLVGDHAILEYRRKLDAIADKRNPKSKN